MLDGIDLDVPAGTTLALLGPSGCGKSTLLKLLAGLLRPDEGRVIFGSETVADPATCAPPEARDLGMVFQDYALWPHMTVAGNVSFPLEMRGVPRARASAAVAQALARSALKPWLRARRRRCRAASSSAPRWRARSSRGRAFCCSTSRYRISMRRCAPSSAARFGALLAQLGTTAVYVTHDQGEAEALAQTIVTLAHGRVARTVQR